MVCQRSSSIVHFILAMVSSFLLVDGHPGCVMSSVDLFERGLPSEEDCDLIVLDDMMNNVTSEISQMFTVGSHHKNIV
ncbi:hypothetical protein TNCV_558261 [Trichonephila clavipes]|nr:hypothetical protein TNCV_558261 [Trichonephila clavipes]